jgi:hypothetical protein
MFDESYMSSQLTKPVPLLILAVAHVTVELFSVSPMPGSHISSESFGVTSSFSL